MAKYVAKAQAMRGKENIINVNVLHGFFASDIEETCLSVVAVTDGDLGKAQKIRPLTRPLTMRRKKEKLR